ncbi:photosystem II reaction center protein Ycf12/Psb30 [Okeania sp.]|nr:photosystem II reaction center protein Ycf12 [Okeania sp.]MEB3341602.1 photosystem II reaction center protein Ycf12 [Okeania sp.]
MGFLTDFFNFFSNINFETIAQLTMLAMVVISGPIVIVLLAARGGDL